MDIAPSVATRVNVKNHIKTSILLCAVLLLIGCAQSFISSRFYYDVDALTDVEIHAIEMEVITISSSLGGDCVARETSNFVRCSFVNSSVSTVVARELENGEYYVSINSDIASLFPISGKSLSKKMPDLHLELENLIGGALLNIHVPSKGRVFEGNDRVIVEF